jgi:CheY-like chemotaxis protein
MSDNTTSVRHDAISTHATPKMVIVNGGIEILLELGALFGGRRYDVSFVDSDGLAYSQIRSDQPELIVLCTCVDDLSAFKVLAMLKLDPFTRHIPVITYTARRKEQDDDSEVAKRFTSLFPEPKQATRMN